MAWVVFHSLRKTVTTKLEQAGVSEGVAADIVGHEKQTITYGLYSGGTSMAQKMEAINNIAYWDCSNSQKFIAIRGWLLYENVVPFSCLFRWLDVSDNTPNPTI